MKKAALFIFSLLLTSMVFAQAVKENMPEKKPPKKFSTGLDLFTDIWQNVPEKMDAKTINRGAGFYALYNSAFGKSPFGVSIGAGVTSHNLYSNNMPVTTADKDSTYFTPITASYKKEKLTLTYLDIPLEINYKGEKKFTASLGFKVGFLMQSHTKYKGDDANGEKIKTKQADIPNLESMRYGATARIGYRGVGLNFYYSLSKLFKKDKGPDMYPISVGLSFRPY